MDPWHFRVPLCFDFFWREPREEKASYQICQAFGSGYLCEPFVGIVIETTPILVIIGGE